MIIHIIYWSVSIIAVITLVFLPLIFYHFNNLPKIVRSSLFAVIAGLFFAKLIAAVFFLVDDIRRGIQFIAGKFFFSGTEGEDLQEGESISRSVFLSWLGTGVGLGLFGTLIYGFGNKYRYQVKKVPLHFPNLPAAFRGLKIVHISDVHCGSFNNTHAVERGINLVLKQQADLILFTGDLVNDTAKEMEPYQNLFAKLKAPMGVFSTLGNHDYGDYSWWESDAEKQRNLAKLKEIHREMGWRLLMNEHIVLERNGEKIGLIGVENWSSKARFPKYGKLPDAYNGAKELPFKILMSHDPSHWDAEVRPKYPDIDLMLAGHTHGMQFGVELPGFKWSPVQYVYRQWAGLYTDGNQRLYVNRGYGFIGYPGRVGILPEITVIQLT